MILSPWSHDDVLCTDGSTLPGRTLSACQNAFRQFQSSNVPLTAPQYPFPAAEASSKKRPYPSDTVTSTGRVLKPKPTYPESSRLPMSTQAPFPHSPLAEPTPPLGEPRKKRGRPTKKEQEERRKQTVFQQQSSMSQDRPPAQFHLTQPAAGPSSPTTVQRVVHTTTTPKGPPQEESANSGSSGDRKRRGRPPRGSGPVTDPT